MIKTKIVVTVGPACDSVQAVAELIASGADVLRINFSHGDHHQHLRFLQALRSAVDSHPASHALMGDLCGPKIRVAPFSGPPRALQPDQEIIFAADADPDDPNVFATTYPNLIDSIRPGDRLLIDDGKIATVVTSKSARDFRCLSKSSGLIKPGKGINLPDTDIDAPALTPKDQEDLDWAVQNKLDYLALSFVRRAADVVAARERLRDAGSDIKLVAKIEKPQALDDLDAIIAVSDAILIARGDLGVEIELARVPLVQKDIIRRCQSAGKPVIVATQMLDSMISSQTPTRAEVSDVANAIFDQADAVMLSGETAIGAHPAAAVRTIENIARVSEEFQDAQPSTAPRLDLDLLPRSQAALALGVHRIAQQARCTLVVVWSESGRTAGLLSKTRIGVPIIALSSNPAVCRRMSLQYGVIPYLMDLPPTSKDLLDIIDELAPQKNWANSGDSIVVVTGHPLGTPTTTDTIHLHCIGYTGP